MGFMSLYVDLEPEICLNLFSAPYTNSCLVSLPLPWSLSNDEINQLRQEMPLQSLECLGVAYSPSESVTHFTRALASYTPRSE